MNCVRCGQETLPNGECYCGATPANVLANALREKRNGCGHVEMKMELEKLRNSLKSERRRRTIQQTEHLIDAARQAQHALEEMDLLVKDFIPNVGKCVLQNYARLNNAPIMASDAMAKLRALLGETGQ